MDQMHRSPIQHTPNCAQQCRSCLIVKRDHYGSGWQVGVIVQCCTPVMPGVSKRSVAGDSLALSLIEGIQTVGVLAWLPSVSIKVAFFFKLFQQVIPLSI